MNEVQSWSLSTGDHCDRFCYLESMAWSYYEWLLKMHTPQHIWLYFLNPLRPHHKKLSLLDYIWLDKKIQRN